MGEERVYGQPHQKSRASSCARASATSVLVSSRVRSSEKLVLLRNLTKRRVLIYNLESDFGSLESQHIIFVYLNMIEFPRLVFPPFPLTPIIEELYYLPNPARKGMIHNLE